MAPTFGDARDYCIEGETGIKTLHPELEFNRSMGEMTFPSGARGKLFSGEEPERMRGPNNYAAWCDELASWRYQRQTWDNLMFTLRKGESRTCITTTPKRSKLLNELEERAKLTHSFIRRTTYDNIANLSHAYIDNIIKPYEGTVLGKQELEAIVLDDVPGALWRREWIDAKRVAKIPDLTRIAVAVDPEGTSREESAETGIGAVGIGKCGCKGVIETHAFVLEDASLRATPDRWAQQAVSLYNKLEADVLVAEDNFGGEMIEYTIKTIAGAPPVKRIHASRGKQARAEPASALYQQGKVHHVGLFAQLEDQMCGWVPDSGMKSPDRIDWLVWALTELLLKGTVLEGKLMA